MSTAEKRLKTIKESLKEMAQHENRAKTDSKTPEQYMLLHYLMIVCKMILLQGYIPLAVALKNLTGAFDNIRGDKDVPLLHYVKAAIGLVTTMISGASHKSHALIAAGNPGALPTSSEVGKTSQVVVFKSDVLPCDRANLVPRERRDLFRCQGDYIRIVREGGKAELIEWAKLKRDFQRGAISALDMKAVGELRKNAITALLRDETRSPCYDAAGSTDLTSDLDFTYMTFLTPHNTVMTSLLTFYARFYAQFGNFSDVTFDTNFYMTNTIMRDACYDEIKSPRIQNLFRRVAPDLMGAWFMPDKEATWQALDDDLAYAGIQENTANVMTHSSAAARLPDMLRFGCALYEALEAADVGGLAALSPDQLLFMVRLLIMLGSVNSNEKYISAYTTAFIVYRVPLPTLRARCLAYLDNLVYLLEWRTAAGARLDTEAYLTFFDASSKYMGRLLACLTSPGLTSPLTPTPDHRFRTLSPVFVQLCTLGQTWRETVRGKKPISSPEGQDVLAQLARIGCGSVTGIMAVVDSVTTKVRAAFNPRIRPLYDIAKSSILAAVEFEDKSKGQLELRVDRPLLLAALSGVCAAAAKAAA